MSYILDALKKSESERGHGVIPGVQTVHSSGINYHQQKKAIWPYFLIAAVLLNIAVITYFIYTQKNPSQSVVKNSSTLIQSTNPIANTIPTTVVETPVSIAPVKPIPAPQTAEVRPTIPAANTRIVKEDKPKIFVPARETVARETVANERVTPAKTIEPLVKAVNQPVNEQVIEQYELPENIQRELPALIISAHVYSSNPAQRSVVVNNEFFEENDYIMDDITLHEITHDGAIFSYNGFLFHNRTVSGWQ